MKDYGIDVNALAKLMDTRQALTLLDVRRKADYEASPAKIPGSRWRDPEMIDRWCAELTAGPTTVVYCVKGGPVSQSVTDRLRREGCDAFYLKGGLKVWTASGKPVE